jgi:hypothetical protein
MMMSPNRLAWRRGRCCPRRLLPSLRELSNHSRRTRLTKDCSHRKTEPVTASKPRVVYLHGDGMPCRSWGSCNTVRDAGFPTFLRSKLARDSGSCSRSSALASARTSALGVVVLCCRGSARCGAPVIRQRLRQAEPPWTVVELTRTRSLDRPRATSIGLRNLPGRAGSRAYSRGR